MGGIEQECLARIPVRILHNYLYCPRLMYLQFVEKVFEHSTETVEGSTLHARVDTPTQVDYPAEVVGDGRDVIRSMVLDDDEWGVIGAADLMKRQPDGSWVIYDYKRGAPYSDDNGKPVPKKIDAFQVQAYMLLARKRGMNISGGAVFYHETRQMVPVDDPHDESELLRVLRELRECAMGEMPLPEDNAPKCMYCSLYSVCLPDESLYWRHQGKKASTVRPPLPDYSPDSSLVVLSPRAYVGKRGDTISITEDKAVKASCPVHSLKSIRIYGNAQMSTQVMQLCMREGIEVSFFTSAGRYIGMLNPLTVSGLDSRHGQYRIAENESQSLRIAIHMICAKISNQRTLLQRNSKSDVKRELKSLKMIRDEARRAKTREDLMGYEGRAAAVYFGAFAKMIGVKEFAELFDGRNRRPPRDPINSLLSIGYSTLCSEITGICHSIGLDPACGVLHAPRYGRPALALDIMEEFRPLIVDSVVLSLVNRGAVALEDFDNLSNGCQMKKGAHQAFWGAYARRMEEELTHPVFNYCMSYRKLLEVQIRQLWRIFRGDVSHYHPITTR